jgi:hypothetical protein
VNRNLLQSFYQAEGFLFLAAAFFYYMFIYPLAVATGAGFGVWYYVTGKY